MHDAIIAATGLYTPPFSVSNSELVEAFNAYVGRFNAEHADAIASGEIVALIPSSVQFIEKASGIMSRHVMNKTGILAQSHNFAACERVFVLLERTLVKIPDE